MLSIDDLFKGRHFDREIIILCVRWYLRFKLSFRDLVEMIGGAWNFSGPYDNHALDFSATSRNSKSAGTASPAEPAPLGASTKPHMMMWTASPQRHHSAKAWSQERHKEGDRP